MTEIDFLPPEFFSRRATLRDQWYLLAIGAVSLLLLLASMVNQSRQAQSLRAQLASLEKEHADVQAQAAEVQRLEARRRQLASEAELYGLLRSYPSLSHVLAAIATSCPTDLSLSRIDIKPERQSSKKPEAAAPAASGAVPNDIARAQQLERLRADRDQTQLLLEITGMADMPQITNLIERLKRTDCFIDVYLVDSKEETLGFFFDFTVRCRLEKVL